MHVSEIIAAELGDRRVNVLETGTIRADGDEYQSNDGWSTLTFAQRAKKYGGAVTSIDLDVSVASKVLTRYGVRNCVTLRQGYSIDIMAGILAARSGPFYPYGVAYLDSDNDPNLILHEYFLAKQLVVPGGLIMVDDVDMGSKDVLKGHAIVPWLDRVGTPYRIETRTGSTLVTGVLVIEV